MVNKFAVPLTVVTGIVSLVVWSGLTPKNDLSTPPLTDNDVVEIVSRIDTTIAAAWQLDSIRPADPADELQVLRRLSLVLHGTIPSLAEIREFESDQDADRIDRWVVRMLADPRFGDYFGERLARGLVGVETGPFLIYRRDRFVAWLSEQIRNDRPWSEITRDVIAGEGLWTGSPQTNFITVANANGELDHNKLAGRTVRAFLGQRIDCAQCHDHPFDVWTQSDFEGLAAFYAQASISVAGIQDASSLLFSFDRSPQTGEELPLWLREKFAEHEYRLKQHASLIPAGENTWIVADSDAPPSDEADAPKTDEMRFVICGEHDGSYSVRDARLEHAFEDISTLERRVVMPGTPFGPEWMSQEGTRRAKLAAWITHQDNHRFGRAITNRVWGLMFGRPFVADRAVDDLPAPDDESTELLSLIASDFRAHDESLHRLIRVIANTRVFRLSSATDASSEGEFLRMDQNRALFPLVRLRPEQVIGSMLQASYVRTINQNSHLFVRAARYFNSQQFVEQYGDPGENELDEQSGTIPQALLRMNGTFTVDGTKVEGLGAAGAILDLSATDEQLIENAFLVCLTRRPGIEEKKHFLAQYRLATDADRAQITEDLFWSLFNSHEFSWHH